MQTLITIAVCLALLLGEALAVELFNLDVWLPHVGVGIVVFLALRPPWVVGCAGVLAAAWWADLLGCSPPGVHALSLTLVFFIVKLGGQRLDGRSALVRTGVAVVAAGVLITLEALMVTMLGGAPWEPLAGFFIGALPSALAAPVGLVVAWGALDRVDRFFTARQSRSLGTLGSR